MKIFIGIVTYNKSGFLREQISRISRYLLMAKDDRLTIAIADNSTNKEHRSVIQGLCNELGLFYMDCDINEGDPSLHHSLALNLIYQKAIEEENDFVMFLDHDTFMFAPSNVIYDTRDKHFSGIGQSKIGKLYLHPNCIVINNGLVPREIVNLSPCAGMDTGGRLADYISTLRTDQINHIGFEYGNFTYSGINDIYEIVGKAFIHFVKGSNWNGNPKANERETVLMEELQKISK